MEEFTILDDTFKMHTSTYIPDTSDIINQFVIQLSFSFTIVIIGFMIIYLPEERHHDNHDISWKETGVLLALIGSISVAITLSEYFHILNIYWF